MDAAAAVLSISLGLLSCSGDHSAQFGPGDLDHEPLQPVQLSGSILTDADFQAIPTSIAVAGERLVVLDPGADLKVHILSRSGSHLSSFGPLGDGPEELKAPWSLTAKRGENAVWIFDIGLSRLTRVALDEDSAGGNPSIIRLTGAINAVQPVWSSDTSLVSPNVSEVGRLAIYGPDGALRTAVGPLPPSNGNVPLPVAQQAWMGTLVSHPAGERLAMVTRHADGIDIYQVDGALLHRKHGPFTLMPRFSVAQMNGQPIMGSDDGQRFGYVSATATSSEVYALFSGRTREGFGSAAVFGRYVHVFDWNGGFKRVLRLDADILAIAISADGRVLYGLRHDPKPAVIAYELT